MPNSNPFKYNRSMYHSKHTNYYLFNVNYTGCKKIYSLVSAIWKFNKWSEWFDKKTSALPHMDVSVIFARLRLCAPPSNVLSWVPTQVHTSNGISIRSAIFFTAHARRSLFFAKGLPLFLLKITLVCWGIWTPSNTWFVGPIYVVLQCGLKSWMWKLQFPICECPLITRWVATGVNYGGWRSTGPKKWKYFCWVTSYLNGFEFWRQNTQQSHHLENSLPCLTHTVSFNWDTVYVKQSKLFSRWWHCSASLYIKRGKVSITYVRP